VPATRLPDNPNRVPEVYVRYWEYGGIYLIEPVDDALSTATAAERTRRYDEVYDRGMDVARSLGLRLLTLDESFGPSLDPIMTDEQRREKEARKKEERPVLILDEEDAAKFESHVNALGWRKEYIPFGP
jgi:hypothetical protein